MVRANQKYGKLRIISGQYRGRILSFLPETGVRPTHDRVRETVFNWLMPYIQDAHCLDFFSGSGGLGFEAASRGAKDVLMCERDINVVDTLESNKQFLSANQCKIKHISFHEKLPLLSRAPFDVVFLDPPYDTELLAQALTWLIDTDSIHDESLIYFETARGRALDDITKGYDVLKHKVTGHVSYGLLKRATDSSCQ